MKIYEFLYCSCIHESSYATMSLHKTKEGAEKAMKLHKEAAMKDYEEKYKREVGRTKEYAKEENLSDDKLSILIEGITKFGAHEDWVIGEQELLD